MKKKITELARKMLKNQEGCHQDNCHMRNSN